MMEAVLPYYCPEFRSGHLKSPCDASLAKIQELQVKGKIYLGNLEKCQECQGTKLKERNAEEPQMAKELKVEKGFCPDHLEEDRVILGPGRRPAGGKIPGKCRSCVQAKKAKTATKEEIKTMPPAVPPADPPPSPPLPSPDRPIPRLCKVCGIEPEKIDGLNRHMGVCSKCLASRGKKNLELGSKASWGPFYIPLNDPKYAEIKEWLEKSAAELEQNLSQAIMYRLKLAHREAMAEEPQAAQ